MDKKEVTLKGLEIVALAGEARSNYLKALKFLRDKDFNAAKKEITAGDEILSEAHKTQTDLLIAEANNQYSETTLTMIHGQDHLMTTLLLKEILHMNLVTCHQEIDQLTKRVSELEKNVLNLKK